jgi:hypothetical protein
MLNKEFHMCLPHKTDLVPLESEELVAAKESSKAESHGCQHHQVVKWGPRASPKSKKPSNVGREEGVLLVLAGLSGAARDLANHLDHRVLCRGRKAGQRMMKEDGARSREHGSRSRRCFPELDEVKGNGEGTSRQAGRILRGTPGPKAGPGASVSAECASCARKRGRGLERGKLVANFWVGFRKAGRSQNPAAVQKDVCTKIRRK